MEHRCVELGTVTMEPFGNCCSSPGTTAQLPEGLENLHLFQGENYLIF